MIEFRYDTQLLIEGKNLSEDKIRDYFLNNFKGDCLIAVGDGLGDNSETIKIHFHTNEPWRNLRHRRRRHGPSIQRIEGLKFFRFFIDKLVFCAIMIGIIFFWFM